MEIERLQAEVADDGAGAIVLSFKGEIDMASSALVSDMVTALLAEQRDAVALDLGDVTFIDSHGITALVLARNEAERAGVPLAVRNPSRQVLDVLYVTGLDAVFTVEHGRSEQDRTSA